MSIETLIRILHEAGVRPTPREIAEALWLADRLVAAAPDGARRVSGLDQGHDNRAMEQHPGAEVPRTPRVPVAVAARTASTRPEAAFPIQSPVPRGLGNIPQLRRALRPLRRRVPSDRRHIVDEAGTAALIASTGVWMPALVPVQERRFDVVLAVDMSQSMRPWRHLTADVRATLTRTGAFRDVRVCHLVPSPTGMAVQTGRSGVALRPGQLIDGAGRRLFMVLTDAVAPFWHDGSASRQLDRWARTGPTVVIQPLPERMWPGTGLPARAARLTSAQACSPNTALQVRYSRAGPTGTPIPIVGLEPVAMRAWARLVAGHISDVPLAVAALAPRSLPLRQAAAATQQASAVQLFRGTASPDAYRLAVCLSAVPVTLDTMRLVQAVAMPGSPPSALAEVLLGGLLLRTGDDTYAFKPGIREELADEMRRSEAISVLHAVSAFVERHARSAGPVTPALLLHPHGSASMPAQVFGLLSPSVARRFGIPSDPRRSEARATGDRLVDPQEVTIGIMTALPVEMSAMLGLVDNLQHYDDESAPDPYRLGTIPSNDEDRPHQVAIVMMSGDNTPSAAYCARMLRTFSNINVVIMVGIAGGIRRPESPERDVRLGDVVVATDGLIDYTHVRQVGDETKRGRGRSSAGLISQRLLRAARELQLEELSGRPFWTARFDPAHSPMAERPPADTDIRNVRGGRVPPSERPGTRRSAGMPQVHHGSFGSGDVMFRDEQAQKELAARYPEMLAIEMEGSGIAASTAAEDRAWFMVRGVADYGDATGKNDTWHQYAAYAAATYVRALLEATPPLVRSPVSATENPPRLTQRELQVLGLLKEGRRNREIARALFISEDTASVHVNNILTKLGAANRVEAAAIAHRLHLGEEIV